MTEGVETLSKDRLWAMACYVPVVNLVICTICSVRMVSSKLCLFHLRQGLVLFLLWFATVLMGLVSQTLSLMCLGVVLLLHVWGAVSAYRQSLESLPVIGSFALKIPPYYLYKRLTGKDPENNLPIT